MRQFITDCANDRSRDASQHVWPIPALANLFQDGTFLFSRNSRFKNDDHGFFLLGRSAFRGTKKPQAATCGGFGDFWLLTQPQSPVRRLGKPIPTGKAPGKLLTARIHWQKPNKTGLKVKLALCLSTHMREAHAICARVTHRYAGTISTLIARAGNRLIPRLGTK